jgi:hypothetical protein
MCPTNGFNSVLVQGLSNSADLSFVGASVQIPIIDHAYDDRTSGALERRQLCSSTLANRRVGLLRHWLPQRICRRL